MTDEAILRIAAISAVLSIIESQGDVMAQILVEILVMLGHRITYE